MKWTFAVLLVIPVLISTSLVSCTSAGFTAPAVHGKVMVGSGAEGVSVPHGETMR